MKRYLFGLFLISFLYIPNTKNYAAETVTMAVDEWHPLISKDLKYNGVLSRIVEESFALVGVKVEYKWEPWKRAYQNVVKKKWDLSPGFTKTEKRVQEVNFSDPVFKKHHVFFHQKSFQFDWKSYDDLKSLKIGATHGYFYGDEFKKAEEEGQINIEYVTADAQSLKKSLLGRIDIFPLNVLTGYSLIKNNLTLEEFEKFTHHPKKLAEPSDSHIIFAKNEKNDRMMKLFNKGLKQLIASGKLKQYFEESNRGDYVK
jgi:polar amino acid transport system substrate-binding protein